MIFFTFSSLIFIAGIWSFFIEPFWIRVERISIEIKNLPPSFSGIKIAQLSDLHSKNFGQRERKTLTILDQLKPDFVFLTGDIVDLSTRNFASVQNFWQALSQNYQERIFAVYGNHEHQNSHFPILANLFKESQIEILNNQSKKIENKGQSLYLIGVDDPYLGYDDIEKAMAGAENNAPKILLAHSPEIFRKINNFHLKQGGNPENTPIDLVLTGHTHGIQVNLPLLGKLFLPLKYDREYKHGLFKKNSTYLYVNPGLGTTLLPLRFNSRPEITLIELK